MNDDQTHRRPPGAGPDPLDDSQPVDVPRYAPTPDPRPDARWAWASPAGARPPAGRPSAGTNPALLRARRRTAPPRVAASRRPAADARRRPRTAPRPSPADPPPRQRGGAGVGTVVAASLLSAVLASGGTVVALERSRRLRPARRPRTWASRSPPRASSPSRSTSPRPSSRPPSGSAPPSSGSRPGGATQDQFGRSPRAASAPASSSTRRLDPHQPPRRRGRATRSPWSSRTAASSRARSTGSTP